MRLYPCAVMRTRWKTGQKMPSRSAPRRNLPNVLSTPLDCRERKPPLLIRTSCRPGLRGAERERAAARGSEPHRTSPVWHRVKAEGVFWGGSIICSSLLILIKACWTAGVCPGEAGSHCEGSVLVRDEVAAAQSVVGSHPHALRFTGSSARVPHLLVRRHHSAWQWLRERHSMTLREVWREPASWSRAFTCN